MISGNLPPAPSKDPVLTFFNNFFAPEVSLSQNVDDAVIGFFQTVTGDATTGRTMAAAVVFTAQTQNIDLMTLLDEFRKLNSNELNAYLTMFLNINRAGTSLLGLSNSPILNKYVARAILP